MQLEFCFVVLCFPFRPEVLEALEVIFVGSRVSVGELLTSLMSLGSVVSLSPASVAQWSECHPVTDLRVGV